MYVHNRPLEPFQTRALFPQIFRYPQRVSPIDFGFFMGGKGPHTKHMGHSEISVGIDVCSSNAEGTQAKVPFLLISHKLRRWLFSLPSSRQQKIAAPGPAEKISNPVFF